MQFTGVAAILTGGVVEAFFKRHYFCVKTTFPMICHEIRVYFEKNKFSPLENFCIPHKTITNIVKDLVEVHTLLIFQYFSN